MILKRVGDRKQRRAEDGVWGASTPTEEAEHESSVRETAKEADRSDLKTWVRGCQGTQEGKNYTEKLSQAIWQGGGQ